MVGIDALRMSTAACICAPCAFAALQRYSSVRVRMRGSTSSASVLTGPASVEGSGSRRPRPCAGNATISHELMISLKTVRNHVSNIFTKLQVSDRAAAIVKARQAGLAGGADCAAEPAQRRPMMSVPRVTSHVVLMAAQFAAKARTASFWAV